MNTLQFRARLIDPGNANAERPTEIFGTSRKEIDDWAGKVLDAAISKDATVLVFQTSEVQVDMVTKRGKPR